ncbi:MAG: hypothetical protein KJZ47_06470 [Gemmatimonadales bacterium]|nr:hypothetical protein [Gemmatimonadales bacterium]
MDLTVVSTLDSIKNLAITLAIGAFVVVNGVAAVALLSSRSRALVQRWTSPWLAANLLLFGVGAGVPLLTGICKSVVQAIAPALVVREAPPPPVN